MRARICLGRVSMKPEDLPIILFSLSCGRPQAKRRFTMKFLREDRIERRPLERHKAMS